MNNTLPLRSLALATLSAALFSLPCRAEESAGGYSWTNNEAEHFAELAHEDSPLVRYMYAPVDDSSAKKRAATYKPYLHVYSPDGSQIITKGPGGLYPHHRGIYFGFNLINYDGTRCDTWHCTNGAYEQHESFESLEGDAEGGKLESLITWHGKKGELFANEARTQTIRQVDGMTQIDFESTLSCADGVKKIHLDGDPQHAGVQFRASQRVADETAKETYYVRTDGKGKPGETRNFNHKDSQDPLNAETTNRPWLALSFVLDGERYTVLYLDNPNNPKPAHYSERDYGRFGSYFAADVTPDKPLSVAYRYLVKRGELSVEECQKLYDEYVK